MLQIANKKIIYRREGEVLIAESFGPWCLRVRAAGCCVQEEDWTLMQQPDYQPEIGVCEGDVFLRNECLKLRISEQGKIQISKIDGPLLLSEYWMDESDTPARIIKSSGAGCYLSQSFCAISGEHFYGLGQNPNDLFDMKGAVIDLCQKNTKTVIPFVYSSQGYGFLWNNPAIGRVEFGISATRWVSDCGRQLDWIVIGGANPAEILRHYDELTGFPPEYPAWAVGLWQSKLRYETQEELLSIAREYRARQIPIALIACDYFHWPQQGEWKFDRQYWPNPEEMVEELKEMGVHLLISIWPTCDTRSSNFSDMREQNMLIRSEHGEGTLMFCRGSETYVDVTDPRAQERFWSIVRNNYWDIGIRSFWLDEAEPEIQPYDYENLRYFLGNGMQVSSLYPFYYAKMFFEGQRSAGQKEILNLVRSAWVGSQRFGIVLWSGDIMANWDSLRRQIKVSLEVSLSGIPWWTSDIGGFHGGNPDSPQYRELMIRWFQFGAFCPVFRIHGFREKADRPKVSPWDPDSYCYSGGSNEIWSFGTEAYEIMKKYILLREKLKPYIIQNMKKTSATGYPLTRPLFFDWPQEAFWEVFDQFMFGADLMVCPVYQPGVRKRQIVFPPGTDWMDSNGHLYHGGTNAEVEAPLTDIPLFVRAEQYGLLRDTS